MGRAPAVRVCVRGLWVNGRKQSWVRVGEDVPELWKVWLVGEQPQGSPGSSSITQSTVRPARAVPLELEVKESFHLMFGEVFTSCLGQPGSTGEAELPLRAAVNLANWTS